MTADRHHNADNDPGSQGHGKGRRIRSADLIEVMRRTVDRLSHDQMARGDLKILSRTLLELRYAFSVFRPYRKNRKVSVFGSARTPETDPTYQTAVDLGKQMAERDWMVVTGAGSGIMEAGHRGAGRKHSMGLNIMLPFEQESNPIIRGDHKLVTMKYFFTRKLLFVKECHAVVCLPGGFGTLDETAEVLTLLQTGKQPIIPVVLLDAPGGSYWKAFGEFVDSEMLTSGMISPEDHRLYRITQSIEETVRELTHFYRVYHSMRYVRGQLVFRLHEELSHQKLERVNDQFADILVKGTFQQSGALPEEKAEPDLAHLPRLTFHFNRCDMARLRMLIDFVNDMD